MPQESQNRPEISALVASASAVLKYQDFKSSARAIFNACKNLIGATAGYVALLSKDGAENEVLFLEPGGIRCTVDPSLPMPIRGLRNEAYRLRQTVYDNDFSKSKWAALMPKGHARLENVLFSPLVIDDQTVGLMGLANKAGGFNDDDAVLASAFGQFAAVSLDNQRMLTSLKKSEERFRAVAQAAINAIVSVDSAGNIIFWNKSAEKIFGYTSTEAVGKPLTIIMPARFRSAHQHGLDHVAASGKSKIIGSTVELVGLKKDGAEFPIELSLSKWQAGGEIFFTGVILDITDRKRAEEELAAESKRLGVTLQSIGDGVITTDTSGRIVLINRVAENLTGWAQEEAAGRRLVEVFNIVNEKTGQQSENPVEKSLNTGKTVGLADHALLISRDGIERAIADSCAPIRDKDGTILGAVLVFRDITQHQLIEGLSSALNNINAAMHSTLDSAEIMQRVIIESTEAIGCDAGGILLRDGDDWLISHVCGLPAETVGAKAEIAQAEAIELAALASEPVVIYADEADETIREQMKEFGVRSALIVPLTAKDAVTGILFYNHNAEGTFTAAHVDFAKKLSTSLSLAIENARLYEVERNIANILQESLLEMPQKLEGIGFGHLYRSATEAARVGGDFYDLFEIGPDRIGVVIGDVSGKGLEAATLTSFIKTTVKAYAQLETSPASILAKANALLTKTLAASGFVTTFFGILNKKTGVLTYCSAGHPPPILKRSNDGGSSRQILDSLVADSPILGVLPDFDYRDNEITLEKDDILLAYTDGIIEARHKKGTFFGEDRLIKMAKSFQQKAVGELPQAIFDEVVKFTGGTLADDIALISISLQNPANMEDRPLRQGPLLKLPNSHRHQ